MFKRAGIDKMCRRKKSSNVAIQKRRLIQLIGLIGRLVGVLAVVTGVEKRRIGGQYNEKPQ